MKMHCLLGCCAVQSGRRLPTFEALAASIIKAIIAGLHGATTQKTVIFEFNFGSHRSDFA
jgi:hypothetical protein